MPFLKSLCAAVVTLSACFLLALLCAALGKHILMPAFFAALVLIGFGENSAALVGLLGTVTALLAAILVLAVEHGAGEEGGL